jgi:hypothetical protein
VRACVDDILEHHIRCDSHSVVMVRVRSVICKRQQRGSRGIRGGARAREGGANEGASRCARGGPINRCVRPVGGVAAGGRRLSMCAGPQLSCAANDVLLTPYRSRASEGEHQSNQRRRGVGDGIKTVR